MGNIPTIPQAELLAIIRLAAKLSNLPKETKVEIFVDNKGILESLISAKPVSGLVLESFLVLNDLLSDSTLDTSA